MLENQRQLSSTTDIGKWKIKTTNGTIIMMSSLSIRAEWDSQVCWKSCNSMRCGGTRCPLLTFVASIFTAGSCETQSISTQLLWSQTLDANFKRRRSNGARCLLNPLITSQLCGWNSITTWRGETRNDQIFVAIRKKLNRPTVFGPCPSELIIRTSGKIN